MDIHLTQQKMVEASNFSDESINHLWKQGLQGNQQSLIDLKYFYMNQLRRIRPLYQNMDDISFFEALENAVMKAIDRGIKFGIENVHAYLPVASQTYFKSFFYPETDSLHIPSDLLRAFSRLEEIYSQIPILKEKDNQAQIHLISTGFDYPIFETRLLFHSYLKWKQSQLRQVDIDLTVTLLPGPQRLEWEIFYEKKIEDIKETIENEIKMGEDS